MQHLSLSLSLQFKKEVGHSDGHCMFEGFILGLTTPGSTIVTA